MADRSQVSLRVLSDLDSGGCGSAKGQAPVNLAAKAVKRKGRANGTIDLFTRYDASERLPSCGKWRFR